ncbi:MAG: glutamate 5-kinase [archaeon]
MDISKYDLIIIKVGTNSVMDENGVKNEFLTQLVFEIKSLLEVGKKVVIVTSGAIGFGKRKIGFGKKTANIKEQQGLAAIGQINLMSEYLKRFDNIGICGAQILVSQHDLMNKHCFDNIKNTFDFLFEHKIVPIVNENDVVATEELRINGSFSDNDELAALLAKQIHADLLVMITTKNGLISRDGSVVKNLSDFSMVCPMGETSKDGRGGIYSKLSSIQTATKSGCDVFVSGPDSFKGFSEGKSKGTFVKGNLT